MKKMLIAVATLCALAQLTGCVRSFHSSGAADSGGPDLPIREEMQQSYPLSPGAKVGLTGINGSVDIEVADIQVAELHMVRSAHTQETLERRKPAIEHTANSLVIRGDRSRQNFWDMLTDRDDVRNRVKLRLPRKVALDIGGINGNVTADGTEGAIDIRGVNGKVSVVSAGDKAKYSGINGSVEVTVNKLGREGLELLGINGPVALQFAGDTNADLNVSGLNGGLRDEGLQITKDADVSRHNFTAKIGTGGAPVRISGINGLLTLTRAGVATNKAVQPKDSSAK